jgi:hypothetical protein
MPVDVEGMAHSALAAPDGSSFTQAVALVLTNGNSSAAV